ASLQIDDDKVHALQGIAVGQLRAGDVKGALKTIDGVKDEESKARALMALADAQAEAGNRDGARETLEAARRVADTLRNDARKEACRQDIAREAIKAGDVKPALALLQAHPENEDRAWILLDVAEAQAAAGERAAASATLKQAWEAAVALKEDGENPAG